MWVKFHVFRGQECCRCHMTPVHMSKNVGFNEVDWYASANSITTNLQTLAMRMCHLVCVCVCVCVYLETAGVLKKLLCGKENRYFKTYFKINCSRNGHILFREGLNKTHTRTCGRTLRDIWQLAAVLFKLKCYFRTTTTTKRRDKCSICT